MTGNNTKFRHNKKRAPFKMKICYVSNNFEVTDNKFLTKLVERNYDVHAVSTRNTEVEKEYRIDGVKYYELCKTQKFYEKRAHGLNPYWFVSAYIMLKRIIADIKPDILHGGYAFISGFICALTKFRPFLLMPWGCDILRLPQKLIVIKKLVSYAIRNSDMITCDAESVKKVLVSKYNYDFNKIIVFPWGINLSLFSPSRESNIREELGWQHNIVLICTRQHEKIYGIKYLVEAIPKIVANENRARFLFIGNGPLTKIYTERIKNLGFEKYVKFMGYVKNELLPKYLNASDIYVSPSLTDGTSICLLEAMACGLPAVVTDVDANLEWIKNGYNGLVCPKRNPEVLSEKISLLIKNEKMRKKMGKINYTTAAERADWEKNFTKLEEIYQKLSRIRM